MDKEGFYSDRLTKAQLNNLKCHKYSATGSTLIDPFIQPFWRSVASKLPSNLAPNMITLIGLLFNVAGFTAIAMYAGGGATDEAPSWAYYFCAFCLFIYQTLDAVDGKQARRLNLSGPLGELFDHGMDSISTFLVSTSVAMTLLCGEEPLLLLSTVVVAMILFYTTHWARKFTSF